MQTNINIRRSMRYGYLEERTHEKQRGLAECGKSSFLPPNSFGSYAQSIFRRLLIHDQLPDTNIRKVTDELLRTLALEDPAFILGLSERFQQFAERELYIGKWRKIRQDAHQEIRAEIKRRNTENPYHNEHPEKPESWNDIPVPEKGYKNKPWQFDMLYRDINFLALKVKEPVAEYQIEFPGDADLFRMKASTLLAADKIVFALDAGENRGTFLEESANIIESKLSLDGLRLADIFLGRALESLQKLKLFKKSEQADRPEALWEFGEGLREALRIRIMAIERRLMLFMQMEKDHY